MNFTIMLINKFVYNGELLIYNYMYISICNGLLNINISKLKELKRYLIDYVLFHLIKN